MGLWALLIAMESTLCIIKPDAVAAGNTDKILDMLESANFVILATQKIQLTQSRAEAFYKEHEGRPFFSKLVAFMSSAPIMVVRLSCRDAIQRLRTLLGETNSDVARTQSPGSIRALFGTDNTKNAAHGSDSPASAVREIKFFFPEAVIEPIMSGEQSQEYCNEKINPVLQKGLTELCRAKPADPIMWLAQWLLDNNPAKPKVAEKPSVIFALGAPGSSMNSECDKVEADFGFIHLAPEKLLAAETQSDSDLGKEIKDIMLHGLVVPSSTMVTVIKNAIEAADGNKFIISNFPYAADQAILFEKTVVPPVSVLRFECSDATMKANGRLTDAYIANYKALVAPMVEKYGLSGQLTTINGDATMDAVHEEVSKSLCAHFAPVSTTTV